MFFPIVNDILGKCRPETADIHQQMLGGSVEIDTYGIDTAFDGLVKGMLELGLVYIMLILSYTDALRIYLHQFR